MRFPVFEASGDAARASAHREVAREAALALIMRCIAPLTRQTFTGRHYLLHRIDLPNRKHVPAIAALLYTGTNAVEVYIYIAKL